MGDHMAYGVSRTAVVGIGNPERGDDAVGRITARNLRENRPENVEIYEADGEATSLIQLLESISAAYLIDACRSGSRAGTIYRFDACAGALPDRAFCVSTHGLGLAEAVEIARALGALPPRCIVYAIEGATFAAGAPLSREAEAAAAAVARRIRTEIIEAQRSVWDA